MDNNSNKQNKNKNNKKVQPVLTEFTGNQVIDNLSLEELLARPDLSREVATYRAYFQRLRALTLTYDEELTRRIQDRRELEASARNDMRRGKGKRSREKPKPVIQTESQPVGDMNMGVDSVKDVHENVVDHAGEESEVVDVGESLHDVPDGAMTQFSLDEFFARPISIYDSTWSAATEENIILHVWDSWSKNPAIRAKLSNYAYFRGNLHVKIAVTGTPYHYGKMMVAYVPYAKYNDTLVTYDDLLTSTAPGETAVLPAYKCYMSQAPGVGYIDFKENRPLQVDIPFISTKSKYKLFNNSNTVISNATSFDDFLEAGQLRLISLNGVRVANDDYDSDISINVYAWMTDVELGSITSTNMNITAESRIVTEAKKVKSSKPKDEYSAPGPVEMVASAVAKVGKSLSETPYIGKLAKATSLVADGISQAAALFGFSRPMIVDDIILTHNQPFAGGSVTMGKVPITKLSVDPKQELSIDPSYGGTDTDDMNILEIASRESFLTTFTWADTDAAMSTTLWTSLVLPQLYQAVRWTATNVQTLYQPTAMMFAAQLFENWRGSITFRFEIVCSKFHRGKLLFKFDPNVPMAALIGTSPAQLNQQNAIIVDIQEVQDLTITVDWASARQWNSNRNTVSFTGLPCDLESASANFNGPKDVPNGFLEVRPINELVQPTDTADVEINVYVKSDDLQVNFMTDRQMPDQRRPIHTESKAIINENKADITPALFLDHFGEKVVSFRQMLKRYTTTACSVSSSPVDGSGLFRFSGYVYPTCKYNYSGEYSDVPSLNLFSYLRFAYMGVRGGYRQRFTFVGDDDFVKRCDSTRITNFQTYDSNNEYLYSNIAPLASESDFADEIFGFCNINGGTLFQNHTNGGIEVEFPFYSNELFIFGFNNDFGNDQSLDQQLGFNTNWNSFYEGTLTGTFVNGQKYGVIVDTAAAEDFTMIRFQGAPFFTETS